MMIRSILFVPGNKEKMLGKSLGAGADSVVWDLEDAVPAAEKNEARRIIYKNLKELPAESVPVYVRINALTSNMLEADLEAIVHSNLYAVMLAKTETADDVVRLEEALVEIENKNGIEQGKIKIHCILETCLGVINAYSIASASDRVEGVSFGAEDFTLDLGTSRSKEGLELAHARGNTVLAAGAAKVAAIDTVYSDLSDEEGFVKECRLARQLGFRGKFAIHPKQVEAINREFSPSEKELEFAEKVVEAFARAQEANIGVITVDGKMIDQPVVEKAKQLLKFKK